MGVELCSELKEKVSVEYKELTVEGSKRSKKEVDVVSRVEINADSSVDLVYDE